MKTKKLLKRRDFLKNSGLAGLFIWQLLQDQKLLAQASTPNRRMLFFYIPAGLHLVGWRGGNAGSLGGMNFSQSLRLGNSRSYLDVFDRPEYQDLKNYVMILDGVDMRCNIGGPPGRDEHHHGAQAALRGYHLDDRGNNGRMGAFPRTSIDIEIARNLQVADSGILHGAVRFAQAGYMNSINHVSEGNLANRFSTDNETRLWDQLFGNFNPVQARQQMGNQTPPMPANPVDPTAQVEFQRSKDQIAGELIRKAHMEEIKRLLPMLGAESKVKLEKHMDVLADMERRAKASEVAQMDAAIAAQNQIEQQEPQQMPVSNQLMIPNRPDNDINGNQNIIGKYKAVNDIVASAFAFDQVRVMNYFGFGQLSSGVNLNGFNGDYHNKAAHNGGNGQLNNEAYTAGRTYMEAIADLMLKLKNIPEGNGNVLDSTSIVTYFDMCNGDHGHRGVPGPYFIFGGGGVDTNGKKYWNTGNYIKVGNKSSNDLFVSLAHCMGRSKDANAGLLQMRQFGNPGSNTSNGDGIDNEGVIA